MKIAQRVKKVSPSLTLEITSLAKKMKQEGEKVINFAAGEPDFDTPEYIKKAAIEAIQQGFTKYTPVSGWNELKETIAGKLQKENNLSYTPSQIIITCGAKHALYNILQVLAEKGDEVVFASPYWVSYPQMVTLSGAAARIVQTDIAGRFKLTKDSLSRAINRRTKVLILNSPANPTGAVYSQSELAEITGLVIKHNLYLISDEIYEKLIFDGKEHISPASLNKDIFSRSIIVNGVSKSYAMTGWRIGYLACADQTIISAINSLQSHSTSNACSISQKAAWEALKTSREEEMQKMVDEFHARRDCMLRGLSEITALTCFKPEGTFYLFCNISKSGLNSLDFAQRLLKEAKVAVIPGKAFGRDDYIRLSFAASLEQIREGVNRLKSWIKCLIP